MPIDVEIQDERGGRIARYEGPPLGNRFLRLAPVDSACFRFIIPWGDTTFSEDQIDVLKIELRAALANTEDSNRQRQIRALLDFLDGAIGVHIYVKFFGD